MNFDNWQERLEEIRMLHQAEKTVSQGMQTSRHLDNNHFEWLFAFIDAQRKVIESYARVSEGMANDYLKLNETTEIYAQKAIKLNEFLQQRMPEGTGNHVIDVAIEYIEALEKQIEQVDSAKYEEWLNDRGRF